MQAKHTIAVSRKFMPLYAPARYKIYYGGRGGGKSWELARALIVMAHRGRGPRYTTPVPEGGLRILCVREFQNSIADSVSRLLKDQIERMGLSPWFNLSQNTISSIATGAEFIFKGLQRNINEIKSLEGVDICWVEEAQRVSAQSWEVLIPTIRKQGSEIWLSFNPHEESDPTYQRFIVNQPPDSVAVKVNWNHNPFFPATLEAERRYCLQTDAQAYEHIWEGKPRKLSEAVIMRGKYRIAAFDEPPRATRFYYGADWGFAKDPTTLVRCFIEDNTLFVDHEAYGLAVDIDETPGLFDSVPGSRQWPIKADSARPETISAMRKAGFTISPARKWPGCVEDGIAHLRGYREIVIHERCKHVAEEMRLYAYKVDKITGDVLPLIADAHNHCIDALRYALDGLIGGAADDALISLEQAQAAGQRVVSAGDIAHAQPVLGVSMPHFGNGASVIVRRQGLRAYAPLVLPGLNSMEAASRLSGEINKYQPAVVFINAAGPVIQRLRGLGFQHIIEVNPEGNAADARYANKRAEMWAEMLSWLQSGGTIVDCEKLKSELVAPSYSFNRAGRMLLEPPDKLKERLGQSPDMAETLALTFAWPLPAPRAAAHLMPAPARPPAYDPWRGLDSEELP